MSSIAMTLMSAQIKGIGVGAIWQEHTIFLSLPR